MPTEQPAPHAEKYVPIPTTPVKSSQIASVGYDASRKMLAVVFRNGSGAEYQYPNIEPKLHADFIGAPSIGGFFGKHIKSLPFKKHSPKPHTA